MTKWKSPALMCCVVVALGCCSLGSGCRKPGRPIQDPRRSTQVGNLEPTDGGLTDDGGSTVNGDCTALDCGGNAIWLGDGVKFRTLHLKPERQNEAKLAIVGFLGPHGEPLAVDVQGDVLLGTNQQTGEVLKLDGLNGAKLLLGRPGETADKPTQAAHVEYILKIDEVKTIPFWAQCTDCDTSANQFPVYRFTAIGNAGKDITVCGPRPGESSYAASARAGGGSDPNPARNMYGTAVISRGDFYDEDTHEVTTTPVPGDDDLFNISCFGTTLSKLHLLRHTSASQVSPDNPKNPTVRDRQTMLRLLTADYCGNGSSFTENGVSIKLAFNSPLYTLMGYAKYDMSEAGSIDALWTPEGALCIGTPRLLHSDPKRWTSYDLLMTKIRDFCARPGGKHPASQAALLDCNAMPSASLATPFASGNYAISGNPAASNTTASAPSE